MKANTSPLGPRSRRQDQPDHPVHPAHPLGGPPGLLRKEMRTRRGRFGERRAEDLGDGGLLEMIRRHLAGGDSSTS